MVKVPHHNVRALAAVAERMTRNMPGHPVALSLQGVINRLSSGALALDNVNANRSPLETEGAHALKVAGLARKLDKEVTTSMNRLGEILREGVNDVQRRIDQKIDLMPDAFASEIRAAFRGLNGKERSKLINELVDGNRGPELAAIVNAPSVLTGTTDDQRARYMRAIVAKHAPAELDEMTGLQGVFDEGFVATDIAASVAKSFIDPSRLNQIERDAATASAAGYAFDQSLQ